MATVWVGGEGLYRERRLKTLDEEAILARSRAWRARIAAGLGDGWA